MSAVIDWRKLVARALPQSDHPGNEPGIPGWAAMLKDVLEGNPPAPQDAGEGDRATCRQIPFAPLYDPFIRVATHRLAASCPSGWDRLSPEARADLAHGLRHRLGYLCGQALELEFSLFRAAGRSSLACMFDEFDNTSPQDGTDQHTRGDVDANDSSRQIYQSFLDELTAGGLARFFEEYCVLARLVGSTLLLFVDSFAQMLTGLECDHEEIRRVFGSGHPDIGPVIKIQPYLSDPHRGNRSVTCLSFASGLSVLHKPKDLGMDQAFAEIIQWLNERSGLLPLKVPRILHREDYGWVEFVQARPFRDGGEPGRYFRRAGMLVCLAYVLVGIDLHHENIIASGEHPVLIDLEMLLASRLRYPSDRGPHASGFDPGLDRSVLETGLLPYHTVAPDGIISDASGLGGSPAEATGFWLPHWQEINTDRMSLAFARGRGEHPRNLKYPTSPRKNAGADATLVEHEADLVEGFRSMHTVLLRLREQMLAPGGPITTLAGQRARIALRPTRTYDLILSRSLRPDCLRDGAVRAVELGVLTSRPPVATGSSPVEPLIRDEISALERMDIPIFFAQADSEDLSSDAGTTVQGMLTKPGYRIAIERLAGLDGRDLARQTAFIRGAVGAKAAAARSIPFLSREAEQRGVLAAADLISAGRAIGDDLRARAIVSEEGATWTGPYYVERQRLVPRLMGYGLFDGTSGVALFLAALGRQTGLTEYADLARHTLRPLQESLRLGRFETIAEAMGPGGVVGFASLIHALVRTGDFLGESLADDAARVAALVTERRIRAMQDCDVIAGAAGTLLSLLSLYFRTNDPGLAARAAACGDILLEKRTMAPTGVPSWQSLDGTFATGFSHGAAGISYALLRLYSVTGNDEVRAAACDGMAHEAALFDQAYGNWPDPRQEQADLRSFGSSWCQGAPGIGLARLGCADLADGLKVERDVEAAIAATLRVSDERIDQLCCGAMGRTELLLSAARRRARPELERSALEIARNVLRKAEGTGCFGFGLKGAVDNPGLFQGAAGIGYQMLRLAKPEELPSLLLWE
ncbi:MAG: type 2 lantipeptide synthetase LanM family protein [Streptosporangiaceae bacterium]|nr:type 2 lantipeptide synthetase LanM family protein [Streptosporangiaceae bacterium]